MTSVIIPPYLIDGILPTQEVNLLAGVSDAGKTRWLFHWILDWADGKKVLGYKTTPVPWVYVSGDRTERNAIRTLQCMGVDPDRIPLIPAFGAQEKSRDKIMEEIAKRGAQFAIIEAFQSLVDAPGHGHQVKSFLSKMSAFTENYKMFPNGLTILGVVESPKLKPNERYTDPRQRVSGVSAWGYYSQTIFLIERPDPKATDDPRRVLYVCPKQGKRYELSGAFDDQGHLSFDSPFGPAFQLLGSGGKGVSGGKKGPLVQ